MIVLLLQSCFKGEFSKFEDEERLLNYVENIPAKNIKRQYQGYRALSKMNPKNQIYKSKATQFKIELDRHNKITSKNTNHKLNACIDEGIKYYKEIGSYPRLSNGGLAKDSAKDKCNKTTGAFSYP